MKKLSEQLSSYSRKDYYPFHMPGHKRNPQSVEYEPSIQTDLTEIDGFDNLHHAQGILREAQERACALFCSQETFFSVNGSTAALQSAVFAAVTDGGKLLMARNCHKAVYHAVYLRRATPVYLYPQWEETYGLNGGISVDQIQQKLQRDNDIQAVILTSPTYDGIVSDIRAIAAVCHNFGVPLLVDEAHGAHFSFHSSLPVSSIRLGADVVVQSLHKTLPAMTQTALLHRCSDRVSSALLHRYMEIFQSSSPSYPLMASIDSCICQLKANGIESFEQYIKQLRFLYQQLEDCKHLRILQRDAVGRAAIYDQDPSKILIFTDQTNLTGRQLYKHLLQDYHLQMEMSTVSYVLGITGIGDTEEGFQRLACALLEIDKMLQNRDNVRHAKQMPVNQYAMPLGKAMDTARQNLPLQEASGLICTTFIYLYPPGIPLIVPGERISQEVIVYVTDCLENGYEICGLEQDGTIGVADA